MLRRPLFWLSIALVSALIIAAALLTIPLTSDDPYWIGFREGFAAALPNL